MSQIITLGLKIDVDTERGTRVGVMNLVHLFKSLNIPATFLFSLGPDNTGRAIKRIFRPGFFKKVSRTSIISTYGLRTLLNGVLLPGPHIGKRHKNLLRSVKTEGFEVGIHCHDHEKWQDNVSKMTQEQIDFEFSKALTEFEHIFGTPAKTAGAPGWQANAKTLRTYDQANLSYASDCRGESIFYPRIKNQSFHTTQLPTTLPTLDELIGRPEYPIESLTQHYLNLLKPQQLNIMTCHAEIEGMKYLTWYKEFLSTLLSKGIQFQTLQTIANEALNHPENIPVCELIQGEVDGRSGLLALQQKI